MKGNLITAETVLRGHNNNPFTIKTDKKNKNYADVVYPNEKPRYMINIKKQECTCKGYMFTRSCKHIKSLNTRP